MTRRAARYVWRQFGPYVIVGFAFAIHDAAYTDGSFVGRVIAEFVVITAANQLVELNRLRRLEKAVRRPK